VTSMLTLHNPRKAQYYYDLGIWRNDTLYSLLADNAIRCADETAIRDYDSSLSWGELKLRVDQLAKSMADLQLRRGDRVSVWLPSCAETIIVYLACSRNGYVCNTSLHQNYTVDEIVGLLNAINTRVLFAQPGFGADAVNASVFSEGARLPELLRLYVVGQCDSDILRQDSRYVPYPDARDSSAPLSEPVIEPDEICYLAFTSGTTGKPKAVIHSDNTLLANVRPMVEDWGHNSSTKLLTLSPLSHHIAIVAINQVLVTRGQLILSSPASDKHILDWIEESEANYVMGVPTHAMDLLNEMSRRDQSSLGEVKTFYMAGSPIPEDVARKFLAMDIQPQNVYGMTENGSHQYTKPYDPVEVITGSVGKACRGYEVKLWNPENSNEEVGSGDVGEIGGRGGSLMLGYFNNQQATEESFNAGGWFLSGDLGRLDSDGNLSIVGRKKDLIIRGGHNIYPSRIECLALIHGKILKAAAFGVTDERLGERVCLAITSDGERLDASDVLQHLNDVGLSKYDMPEYYLLLDELPLTASGKVLKRTLMQWVNEQRIVPQAVRWQGNSEPIIKQS
jgi:acyl-CoA synthetase